MRIIIKHFKRTWQRLSIKGRRVIKLYTFALCGSVFVDAAGLWMISNASMLWINSTNETIKNNISIFAVLGMILFILRSAIVALCSFVCFRLLINDEVELSLQNYDSINSMPYELARELPFSTFFDTTQQSPQVAIHTLIINSVTVLVSFLNIFLVFAMIWTFRPIIAIGTFLYFVIIGLVQYFIISRVSEQIGNKKQISFETVQNNLLIAFRLSKIFRIMDSKTFRHKLKTSRKATSKSLVDIKLIQLVPRLTLEVGLVLGALLIYGLNSLFSDTKSGELGIIFFLLAGFRVIPILSFVQSLISSIMNEIPYLEYEVKVLGNGHSSKTVKEGLEIEKTSSKSEVFLRLDNVSYTYSGSTVRAVDSVSINFQRGRIYAIAGMPGSGKSTLMDICMGLLEPTSGLITQTQQNLRVGFVPQNTDLFDASVSWNIALEWDDAAIDKEAISRTLKIASKITALNEFVGSEINARELSGGQQQLICLLRALYRNPDILFLDEATSSLDNKSESQINELLQIEKSQRAIIVIAHRMSSIRNADEVIFMESGFVKAIGNFEFVRANVEQFESLFQKDKNISTDL